MLDDVEQLIRQYSLAEPRRAAGGLRALSGFRYQLLTHLAQFVKEVIDRNAPPDDFTGLSEFLSDFSSSEGGTLSLVQCKTTLTRFAMRQAAAEFVLIEDFLQSTGPPEVRLTPQFKLFYQRTNEDSVPHWDTIEPALRQSTKELLAIWRDLVDAGRIESPECKADPQFDLTKNLKTLTDDPFAVRAELVEAALSRGNDSASKLRDELWKVVERARRQDGSIDCVYLDHQDFSPLPRDRTLRVGSSPTLLQLRKGQYFDRRDHVLQAEQALKTTDFPTDELSIFWIAGRSGSGKSALLLQLMQEVVANGDLVAYPREGAPSLPNVLRNWPTTSERSGAPRYLFVDDLYAPNVRDQLSLDSIQSLIMADGERTWPIIVTCGPTEFRNAIQRDFGGKPLMIESWELQPIGVPEREDFIQWFEETTGAKAKRGRAAEQSDGLMISLAHELRWGELGQFATRFADRLAASGLTESVRIVLAVNRLYIEAPRSWLTPEEWLWLDELNNDGDFSIGSNEIANEAYIRLAHPYITDAIYRKVRQPLTALACASDIKEAFRRCMEQASDINSRIGRRILTAVACDETDIDVEEAFLAAKFVDIWTANGDRVCASNPYARADFWLSWCQWEHRKPELNLADRIGKVPIEETLAAVVDAQVLRHAILARLQELFPNDQRVRSAAKDFLGDSSREDDNGWGFIWEQLLHTATGNETNELVRVGQEWASNHAHSKSWPRVAQELLQVRNREALPDEDAFLSLVDSWLSDYPFSRSWNFVLGARLEFAQAINSDRATLEKSGTDWLREHPNHPDWSFVWRKLYGVAVNAQEAVLSQLAVSWLGHSQSDRGWTYVCETVADSSNLSDESLRSLAIATSDWLAEFPQSESWGNAWAAFFTVQLRLGNVGEAINLGTDWLLTNQGRSAWQHTLCEFLRLANEHTEIDLPILELAANWSIENSHSENTSKALRGILRVGEIKEYEPLRTKVRETCIRWLGHDAHLKSHHWPRVFRSANRVFGDEAFCDMGVSWLQSNETNGDWEGVALAILNSAEGFPSRKKFARLLLARLQSDRAFVVSLRAAKKLGNSEVDDVPELLQTLECRHTRLREIKNAINAKRPVVYEATIVKTIRKQDRELLVVDVGVPAYLDKLEADEQHRLEIGTEISVSPTKCDPKTGTVWVSVRRASVNQQRHEFVMSIAVGDVVEGAVCHTDSNYVLVSVGDISIYVPKHEIAWQHPPPDPLDCMQDGDEVTLKVTRVDKEKLKVAGSIRQVERHPLENGTITEGMILAGYITAFKGFGVIVTLPQGITGLLHETEIFARKRGKFYPSVKTAFSIDQRVDVLIHSIDAEAKRIELKLPNGPSFR